MAKEELLTIEGVVDEILPDGLGCCSTTSIGSSLTQPAKCVAIAFDRS